MILLVVGLIGWVGLRAMATGVSVSVLGARSSGKTTLIRQLQGASIDDVSSTAKTEMLGTITVWYGPFRVFMRKVPDLAGGTVAAPAAAWSEWQKHSKDKDVVLYLINAGILVAKADAERTGQEPPAEWKRVLADVRQIAKWRDEQRQAKPKSRGPFYGLVVSFRDRDPRSSKLSATDYRDQLDEQLQELRFWLGQTRSAVASGNLRHQDEVRQILKELVDGYKQAG